jgi:hypothetical protein
MNEHTAPEHPHRVGDTVRLNSNYRNTTPWMTVTNAFWSLAGYDGYRRVPDGVDPQGRPVVAYVGCVYFDQNHRLQSVTLPAATLRSPGQRDEE